MPEQPLYPPPPPQDSPYPPQAYPPMAYGYTSQQAYGYAPVPPPLPEPVRLHWGWLLLLNVLTRGLFEIAWLIVQANWVRKVRGTSKAFVWSIVYACLLPAIIVLMILAMLMVHVAGGSVDTVLPYVMTLWFISFFVVRIFTIFTLRNELEESPIHLSLGGVMTFFFAAIYFQYHLRDFEWQPTTFTPGSTFGLTGAAPLQASPNDAPGDVVL